MRLVNFRRTKNTNIYFLQSERFQAIRSLLPTKDSIIRTSAPEVQSVQNIIVFRESRYNVWNSTVFPVILVIIIKFWFDSNPILRLLDIWAMCHSPYRTWTYRYLIKSIFWFQVIHRKNAWDAGKCTCHRRIRSPTASAELVMRQIRGSLLSKRCKTLRFTTPAARIQILQSRKKRKRKIRSELVLKATSGEFQWCSKRRYCDVPRAVYSYKTCGIVQVKGFSAWLDKTQRSSSVASCRHVASISIKRRRVLFIMLPLHRWRLVRWIDWRVSSRLFMS